MAKQKEADPGTTIITDPVPDSVLHPDPDAYDDDFGYLATPPKSGASPKPDEKPVVQKLDKEKPDEKKPDEVTPPNEVESIVDEITKGEPPPPKPEDEQNFKAEVEAIEKKYNRKISATPPPTDYEAVKTENVALKSEVESLKNVKVALDEITKDPTAYAQKHFPKLLSPSALEDQILAKVQGEFGNEFRFEPAEAYSPGTKSYQFRLRLDELRDQNRREVARQESESREVESRRRAKVEESKVKVMKRYKLTDAEYQEQVVKPAKSIDFLPEHMAMIIFAERDRREFAKQVIEAYKKRANITGGTPKTSTSDIHAEGDDHETSERKEFAETFGD